MTLQQTINASTAKARELFDKLENTSDQAVKTRENLYAELSRELHLHADIEERDLLPALRRNDETKELVPDAARLNRELRAKTDELVALPKGDASFLPRLAELRKTFQQQIGVERRELVPAARKNLSEDQVEAVERKIEARLDQAEEQQRAEAEQRREEARRQDEERKEAARRQAERNKAAAATKQAATAVADATKQNVREVRKSTEHAVDATRQKAEEVRDSAAEAVRHGAESVRETADHAVTNAAHAVERARDNAADRARRVREGAAETVAVYRETARERGADVKAVGSALRNFGKVGSELRSVMVNSIKRSGRDSLNMGKQLLRNPRNFGPLQREYMAAATRNLMESTNEMLAIVRSASSAGRLPVEQRLKATS